MEKNKRKQIKFCNFLYLDKEIQFFWTPRSKFKVTKHRVDIVRKHINVEKVKKKAN